MKKQIHPSSGLHLRIWLSALLHFIYSIVLTSQVNTFTLNPDPEVFKSVSEGGSVTFNESLEMPLDQVFKQMGEVFNLVSPFNMETKKIVTDKKGLTHFRFQQSYKGIPIYGAEYMLHTHIDGQRSGNGKILNPKHVNETTKLSETEALEKLLGHVNAKKYYWEDSTREARVRLKQNNSMATYYPKATLEFLPTDNLTSIDLCYTFHVYCLEGGSSGKYYVDAADGHIRKFLPAESNCESTSFASNFNGNQTIATVDIGDEYELEDDCDDSVYGVYDENNNADIFTDATNTWNTDWQRSAATSLWAIKQSFYAYLGEFNLNGHDGDDGNIDIYQGHFFSSGGNNNASFHYDAVGDDEIYIGIGDTDDVTDDYNTLDILGHEFTHGVDEYSAQLEYVGESGALDESFADIFGEWIENHELGTNDWFLGAERIAANNCPDPLRYMVDPGAQNVQTAPNCQSDFGQPNTYLGNNWYPISGCDPEVDSTDNCGVHTNSGVQNQMFYLLVEGGLGWNDGNTCHASIGSGYPWEVDGIGMEDAITIGYYAHVTMLGPNSDYHDARHAWVATAAALYGECSNQAIQAGKAWYAVGFNPPSVPDYVVCNIEYGNNPVNLEQSGRIRTGDGCVVIINDGGSLVTFSAGLNVVLKPGFEAIGGSRFRAIVTDCDFARY